MKRNKYAKQQKSSKPAEVVKAKAKPAPERSEDISTKDMSTENN